jgi:hypothetical protein
VIKGGVEGKKAAAAVMWEGQLLPAWYIPCAKFAKDRKYGTAVQLSVDELALALLFKADFVRYVAEVPGMAAKNKSQQRVHWRNMVMLSMGCVDCGLECFNIDPL